MRRFHLGKYGMGKSHVEEEENCRLSGTRGDVQRRKEATERP